MPRKKQESSLKRVYKLWWDYLKLSADYRQFCKWMDRRIEDPGLPIPKQSNWFELWDGYKFFGNIHVDSFEQWWQRNKSELNRRGWEGFPGPIEDYTDFIMIEMEDNIRDFKRRTGKEPSLEQFKKGFLEHLKFPGSRFYFMVSVFEDYQDFEDLGKRFIKILKEKQQKRREESRKRDEEDLKQLQTKLPFPFVKGKPDKYSTWAGRWRYPTTRLRLDEVERYLKVLNYFAEGLTWRQIAKEIYPKYEYVDTRGKLTFRDSIKRAVYQDRENAVKIISNAERGIFPGQYSVRPEKLDQRHSS